MSMRLWTFVLFMRAFTNGLRVSDDFSSDENLRHTTIIKPPWPGKAYEFACTLGTDAKNCAKFGTTDCFEPERDTQEVLNSFLTNCPGCLYVDIGCNIGYFAAHAAQLGATVDCYEPTPSYVETMKLTRELNNAKEQWQIHNLAVVPDDSDVEENKNITFKKAYQACGSKLTEVEPWQTSTISMRQILAGRKVELLKIDIDSIEGALFHTMTKMIKSNETQIETIIVEVGDNNGPSAWLCGRNQNCNDSSAHPRGGDIQDFWELQQQHGYNIYRVNIHTGREIFDWKGTNMNQHMVPQVDGLLPMFSIRNMRKLEKILPSTPLSQYRKIFRWGTSFLVTRLQLAETASHHEYDLYNAQITNAQLNNGMSPTGQKQ